MALGIAQVDNVVAPVKFGFTQLLKPTPEFAKLVFRFVLYMATFVVFLVNMITEIPEPLKQLINHYAVYAITAVHFLSKMFGVQVDDVNATSIPDAKQS